MKPDYSDVKNVDLGKLSDAVDEWRTLPGKIKQLGLTFRTEVVKGLKGSNWSGEAAESAFVKFDDIEKQISDAAKEASAIYGLLSSALDCFRNAKRELCDIEREVEGHVHLSLNGSDGSVYVDEKKVDPESRAMMHKSYLDAIEAYRDRTQKALEAARDGDRALKWALLRDGDVGRRFNADAYGSLKEAQVGRERYEKARKERENDESVRMQPSSAPFGSGTIKPVAEFLSYRPWINAGSSTMRGDFGSAWTYFLGGTPAYALGKMSEDAKDYPGGGGRHRKPSLINKTGWLGTKIFGAPIAVGATLIDYAYTPESDPAIKEKNAHTLAPGPLNRRVR